MAYSFLVLGKPPSMKKILFWWQMSSLIKKSFSEKIENVKGGGSRVLAIASDDK